MRLERWGRADGATNAMMDDAFATEFQKEAEEMQALLDFYNDANDDAPDDSASRIAPSSAPRPSTAAPKDEEESPPHRPSTAAPKPSTAAPKDEEESPPPCDDGEDDYDFEKEWPHPSNEEDYAYATDKEMDYYREIQSARVQKPWYDNICEADVAKKRKYTAIEIDDLRKESQAAADNGTPWQERGPPNGEGGTWRGQQWRPSKGRWGNRGGGVKAEWWTSFYKAKKNGTEMEFLRLNPKPKAQPTAKAATLMSGISSKAPMPKPPYDTT